MHFNLKKAIPIKALMHSNLNFIKNIHSTHKRLRICLEIKNCSNSFESGNAIVDMF